MILKESLTIRSHLLKAHVTKYALLGLSISLMSIIIASILVSYQLGGRIDIEGIIQAQKSNIALWALDLTPFMFAYWGQSFCYELANKAASFIEDQTKTWILKHDELASKLHHETNYDHLTHLPNQRLLSQQINENIKKLQPKESLALIIIHIRSFQEMNYQYGQANGDRLLVQVAERLKNLLLEPELLQAYMGLNMIARLQGATFAILIPHLREAHHFEKIVPQLIDSISFEFSLDQDQRILVQTTAGIACYPAHGENDLALIDHANSSLFHAEKEGKPYAIYDPSMGINNLTSPQ